MPPVTVSLGGRLSSLDWLRFFVVLSLAPFQAAATAGTSPEAVFNVTARLLKSSPPINSPIGGMMRSFTRKVTIVPNAVPA